VKKLKLENLEVESFVTAAVERQAGTVVGHAPPTHAPGCLDTVEDYTCGIWCPPTQDPANTGPCAC
jgi:hypothetical protein